MKFFTPWVTPLLDALNAQVSPHFQKDLSKEDECWSSHSFSRHAGANTLGLLASMILLTVVTIYPLKANAQFNPFNSSTTNSTTQSNSGPTFLGVNSLNDQSTSFMPSTPGVEASQMAPSLSSPLIGWVTPPESNATRNAIPAKVNKLLKEKKYTDALVEIDAQLKINPKNVQLRFVRARTLINLGQLEKARLELVDLTEKYPELPEPYNNLAALYAGAGKLDAAKENLEMALKIAPKDSIAMFNLAEIYTRLAAENYKNAYALNRKLGDAPRKQKLAQEITQEK